RVGVDHHAVEIHPEVEMRAGPGGVAGIAHVADDVARPDPAVLTELVEVAAQVGDTVVTDQVHLVAADLADHLLHGPRHGGAHGRATRGEEVVAVVIPATGAR